MRNLLSVLLRIISRTKLPLKTTRRTIQLDLLRQTSDRQLTGAFGAQSLSTVLVPRAFQVAAIFFVTWGYNEGGE